MSVLSREVRIQQALALDPDHPEKIAQKLGVPLRAVLFEQRRIEAAHQGVNMKDIP